MSLRLIGFPARRFYRLPVFFSLIVGLGCLTPELRAQTAHFTASVQALGGGFSVAVGVAVDGSGNVFVADTNNNAVKEILAADGYTTVKRLHGAFNHPRFVALDAVGNVFVSDSGNFAVKEILAAGGYTTVNTVRTLTFSPQGLAVDGSGNIFVADPHDNAVKEILEAGGYTTINSVGSGFNYPFGVALDASANLYVGDTENDAVKEVLAAGGYTIVKTLAAANGHFAKPWGVSVDANGDVFVADSDSSVVKEILAAGGYTLVNTFRAGFNIPTGVAVDRSGNIFVADQGNSSVKEITRAKGRFGSVSVGASGPNPVTLIFTFDSQSELGSKTVLTQGATGLDFTDAGTGSCKANTGNYAGSTCTIDVTFEPRYSGSRYGAAELLDTSGNLLATGYVQGTGVGPQVTFANSTSGAYLPNAQTDLGSGFLYPGSVAMDGSGNIFVADTGNDAVKEIVKAGGYTNVKTIGSGFSKPAGVAIDGSGNVFVADSFNDSVREILAAGGYSTILTLGSGFSRPEGLAVDGSGNVFVADRGNNAVKEIVAVGGYTLVRTLGSGFSDPEGVAVDQNGNVFVADYSNQAVKEIVAAGDYATIKTFASGLLYPWGVAVDGNGNVFVADPVKFALEELAAGDGYATVKILGHGMNQPEGVAVDARGNIYVADTYNHRVEKLDFAHPPSLSFAPTLVGSQSADSPQTVTVSNNGNAALTFPIPASSHNPRLSGVGFTLDSSATCPQVSASSSAAGKLGKGTSCVYAVDFAPLALGTASGSLRLTDNNLNAAGPGYATQGMSLSGTTPLSPFGVLGAAVDDVTFSTTVGQSDSLKVQGWVADLTDGDPLSNVTVYIDGTFIGTPTLGLPRPNVAAKYGNAYLNSGYLLLYPASQLSLGTHKATVVAIDSGGRSTTLGPNIFTVATTAGLGKPFGTLGEAVDSVTSSTTVSHSHSLKVQGWVADALDGAPLSNVKVYVDGVSIGTPTLGIARPDIATAYGSKYLNSGYMLLYPASSLSLGKHTVTVVAIDSGGRSTTFGPLTITVQ